MCIRDRAQPVLTLGSDVRLATRHRLDELVVADDRAAWLVTLWFALSIDLPRQVGRHLIDTVRNVLQALVLELVVLTPLKFSMELCFLAVLLGLAALILDRELRLGEPFAQLVQIRPNAVCLRLHLIELPLHLLVVIA